MPERDLSLIDRPEILMILFHPRPDIMFDPDDERNALIPVADGISIGGRLHVAAKDAPVVLLFHGNGEIAADYDGIAPIYLDMGISLFIVDYRGYGRSDGTPTATTLLDDAMPTYKGARDVLSERGLGDNRFFLMGRSLGSGAALEVASQVGDKIDGLIIESGFAHTSRLLERLGGAAPADWSEEKNGFNNAGKIERVTVPTLIIHGEEDIIIPYDNGKTLFEQSGSQNKKFVGIPLAGHNDLLIYGQRDYFGSIRDLVLG